MGLGGRIAVLATAVAVITAVLAGALAVGLSRTANASSARSTLSRLADASQATADQGASAAASQRRARQVLQVLKVQSLTVTGDRQLVAGSALARASVTPDDISRLLAGDRVSVGRRVQGQRVLIEGRPTQAGAIVLVQRQVDATATGNAAIRRLLLALVAAVAIAVLLGLLVARRIARPLRQTAAAARALATGERHVQVEPDGPAEVAEVADAVNTLSAALSHSEARQREFLLSVSHDLRTPLTAISGYAESLADGVVAPDEAPAVGAVMVTEARRLDRLVSDLLDLARLDGREFRVDLTEVDLVALVQSAAQVWGDRCAAVGVLFRLEVGAAPLRCRTDPGRLRQLLDGLLENALRVTPAGRPIVLAVRRESSSAAVVVAEVRDGGPGLTDADLPVAFERSVLFERYRGVRQVGTGLGLAIVHALTTRIGGTVEAGHAVEGGARFTVRLPAG
jgi:two-component system sensor histidine kinase BaeS